MNDRSGRQVPAGAADSGVGAGASVTVNGAPLDGVKPGEFLRIEREWKNGDAVELHFPMRVRHFHMVSTIRLPWSAARWCIR